MADLNEGILSYVVLIDNENKNLYSQINYLINLYKL